MNTVVLLVLTTLLSQSVNPAPPVNNPAGVWQSDSGTRFEIKRTDSDLKVQLVDGSNPVYLKYEVKLKNAGEVNTYEGEGFFIAKVKERECRFDTAWHVVVVQPELMVGYISHVVPDPATCEVQDRRDEFTQLKKVK
jgi:hypothetical protein